MKTNTKRHLFIGTGLVVALSCGITTLPAVAAAGAASAIIAPAADLSTFDGITFGQADAPPTLAAGQRGELKVLIRNNRSQTSSGGAVVTFVAPSGTTFTTPDLRVNFPGGWSGHWRGLSTLSADSRTLTLTHPTFALVAGQTVELWLSIQSDAANSRAGVVQDGRMTVTGGTAIPQGSSAPLAYDTGREAVTLSQTVTPSLEPGRTGEMVIRYTNNMATATPKGAKFEVVAPEGTTLTSATSRFRSNTSPDGWAVTGVLSADKRSATFELPTHTIVGNGWGEAVISLSSASDNTRSGVIGSGSMTVVGGAAFPVGATTAVAYEAAYEALTTSQTLTPKLSAGQISEATIRYTNNRITPTGMGTQLQLVAPSGTTFLSTLFTLTQDTNPEGWSRTGTLSADRRTLTIDLADFRLGAGGWGELRVPLQSAADNGRSGVVADGKITVTGGAALPVASSAAIAYEAVLVAPKAITLEAPALGAEIKPGTPVFTGTGQPGAAVTVRGTFGTLLGSGVVDAQGKWAIPSTVSLVAGSYSGTVVQTAHGIVSSAPFSFTAAQNTAVTLTSPAIDAVVAAGKPTFSGTGKPGATVTVRGQFGTLLASATVDARGLWAMTSAVSLVPGSYAGNATQDADGKVTAAPFKFTAR